MSISPDANLIKEGERKIEWVAQHSPVLNRLRDTILNDGTFQGKRLALCVHLEAKTAYLATILADCGAQVVVTGSNPHSTKDDVCASLASRGITVYAKQDCPREVWEEHLLNTIDTEPEIIIDDGAELVSRLITHRPHLASKVIGSSEQTTTGVIKLRAMEKDGVLPWPAIAANDAMCKHMFDNRYGTGQSAIGAVLSSTNLLMAGRKVVIIGYGWCGRGLARYADGMGARVIVVEVDPVKALEAIADGFRVMNMQEAAREGEFFITATGNIDAIRKEHFEVMQDGALIANAGHYEHEINLQDLSSISVSVQEARPYIKEYRLQDGRRIHVIADGELVNLAAGDGHPVEIIDLTFAVQALSAHYVAKHRDELQPGVYNLPEEIDKNIAKTKLETLGIKLEGLTHKQQQYLNSWRTS